MERKDIEDYLILLEERERFLVDQLCGRRYSREKHRYKRHKTSKKTIFTRFGKITQRFVYVKDVSSGESFAPLLDYLQIPKHQHLSDDFKQILSRKASRTTYQKGVEDIVDSFSFGLCRQTLHKYVKETCSNLEIEQEPDPSHRIILADGSKVKSGHGAKHEPKTIISVGEDTSDKVLLRQAINKSWREMVANLNLTQYEIFVGDGETGLASAFMEKGMKFHFCHEHAERDLAFYLWKDGLNKKEYAPYSAQFEAILHTLQNSTKKHKEDKDWQRLLQRIDWAKREVNTLAVSLNCRGLFESSAFLMRNKVYFVTASEMAIIGLNVPFTTNVIERVMREVGDRTKKKGMYWSEKGLDRILKMVLKRYFLPQDQRTYKHIFTESIQEAIES